MTCKGCSKELPPSGSHVERVWCSKGCAEKWKRAERKQRARDLINSLKATSDDYFPGGASALIVRSIADDLWELWNL